jgi:hypothetical protein
LDDRYQLFNSGEDNSSAPPCCSVQIQIRNQYSAALCPALQLGFTCSAIRVLARFETDGEAIRS